ncbi:Deoxyuridine 5'-triphosphate nucleotidohydrolase [Candidatus Izimaplasma bacterium HR1]|uniref:dCTP deaminase domain-containing protein n=1 Tax=Candidatus Izimoplasma sp. HR1 TaxID=1541959 RepID=UPI0004F9341E|nr:Deoxyuridine 5'-triphosphate nucleotidohydrolase [Candidatus Izimaplasma bacterium HR1]
MRGFEKAKDYEELNIELPKRGTRRSAGYDFALIEETIIPAGKIVWGKTGLKAYMTDDEVLFIYPRSSLARKRGLMLSNNVGVVDSDYYGNPDNDGHIMISLYNFTDKEVVLPKGERVAQGIFQKYLIVTDEEEILKERLGGFGSTGN